MGDGTKVAAKIRSWKIGKVTVTRIEESEAANPVDVMFSGATPGMADRHAWLKPHFVTDEGLMRMAFNSFVVESEGKLIMVDTCYGNDKTRTYPHMNHLQTAYLETLGAAGFSPEQFDYVLCTHLHVDHVGWNTRWTGDRWVPTFPNARYLFGRVEWDYFQQAPDEGMGDFGGDSITPIFDAGLCDLVETDHRITSEVGLEATPGHTPGHVAVRISSEGMQGVITGDLIHHPIQLAELGLASNFDHDQAEARATRERFVDGCCGQGALLVGTHFADPTAGRVVADGDGWRLVVE